MKLLPNKIGLIKESYNLILDEDNIWIKPLWYNSLIKIDISSGKSHIIGSIPQNKHNIRGIEYMSCFKYNEWIILIPFYSIQICFYNTLTNKYIFKTIEGLEGFKINKEAMLQGHVEMENYSYMFGAYPFIVRLDLKTFDITVFSEFNSKMEDTSGCFGMRGGGYNNKLILSMPNKSSLFYYSLDTQEGVVKKFNLENPIGNFDIAHIENRLYWLSFGQEKEDVEVIEYNLDDEEVQRHKILVNHVNIDKENILSIVNEKIFLLPRIGQDVVEIDMETWNAKKIQNVPYSNCKNKNTYNYYGCINSGNNIFSISTETEELICIDTKNLYVKSIKLKFEEKDYIEYFKELYQSGNVLTDDLDVLMKIV